jgi:hypothetical protein
LCDTLVELKVTQDVWNRHTLPLVDLAGIQTVGKKYSVDFPLFPSIATRNVQFWKGDFSAGWRQKLLPEVHKMSTLQKTLDFERK